MRARLADSRVPLVLALGALLLAMLQEPGRAVTDTKIDLQVAAGSFLGEVAASWTPTGSLGHVWGSQYVGYLFPIGPFYALGELLGLPPWLTARLWLGVVLALGAWGVVRLLDAMLERPRGAAHLVAGALYVLNPYVVIVAPWRSVMLLGYAALPWLLLAVHGGVRVPRSLWWPAAFALLVTATGPGVNAALTAFVLLAPTLLLLYEPLIGRARWGEAWSFAWRAGAVTLVASLWWLGPVLVQLAYGVDFQQFTEGPAAIWQTSGFSESLRLMGFWLAYARAGPGGDPYLSDAPPLLFDVPVVAASLLVPALALGGFAWTRRWRYGPFFVALTLLGALVLAAGFPEGTLLRDLLVRIHDDVAATRFLRTTYKAAPLVALGLACLGGAAAGAAWRRLPPRPAIRVLAVAATALLVALAAWPMTRGDSVEDLFDWDRIPAAWDRAAADVDRELPANSRAVVLPGQLFGFYDWGGTFDPLLPSLAESPVAGRFLVPWADLRATDLLWSTDALVQEGRVRPGQLHELLALMGTGAVVTGTDDDRRLSGAVAPAAAARDLAELGRPAAAYGPVRSAAPGTGSSDSALPLPRVRRYAFAGRGIVRVAPRRPVAVVDGSADALAGMAAFGPLPRGPVVYAGDRSAEQLRRAAAEGAALVISDSNRRRVLASSVMRLNEGWTVGPDQAFGPEAALLDPFPQRGSDAQTVASLEDARSLSAHHQSQGSQFPERRPYAAFDGDESTVWLADRSDERWLELELESERDLPWLEVLPYGDSRGRPVELEVNGRAFRIRPGWNRLPVRLEGVRRLRLEISRSATPPDRNTGPGGLREVRAPGLRIHERLRTPRLVAAALGGRSISRSDLTLLLERTTAPDPFRPRKQVGELQFEHERDSRDAERGLARIVELPAARQFAADAFASVDPAAPDPELDRLAGTDTGGAELRSSSRFEGMPARRASAAFDGDRTTGWIGEWVASAEPDRGTAGAREPERAAAAVPSAWLEWRRPSPGPAPRRLRLARVSGMPYPTSVRVVAGDERSPKLAVGPDGSVRVPPLPRASRFRLEVVAARAPAGAPRWQRERRAVGIAELAGPGLPRARQGARRRIETGCGALRVVARGGSAAQAGGGAPRVLPLRVSADAADFERGLPLAARSCGRVALPRGEVRIDAPPGVLRVDLLRMVSPAPRALSLPPGGGRVLDPGDQVRDGRDGARLALRGPSWLVLGEGYNRGWRASCDGRNLGEPVPVDGFANGWPVERDCREVDFAFAPGKIAGLIGLPSAIACLAMLGLIAIRRPPREHATPAPLPDPDPPARWPLWRALAVGALAALVLGAIFALRAGVVLGPLVAFVLWRGVPTRVLCLAAGFLLGVVVPLCYAIASPADRGGWNTDYAKEVLGAHWVAAAAFALLAVAVGRSIVRRPRGTDADRLADRSRL